MRTVVQFDKPRKSLQTNFNCCSLFVSLQPTDPCPSLRVSPRRSRSRSRSCGIATGSARSTSCKLTSRLVRSQPSPPSFQVEEWPSKGWHCPVALWHCGTVASPCPVPQPIHTCCGATGATGAGRRTWGFSVAIGTLGRRQTSGVATGRTGITGACSNLYFKFQLLYNKCVYIYIDICRALFTHCTTSVSLSICYIS